MVVVADGLHQISSVRKTSEVTGSEILKAFLSLNGA